MEKLGPIGFGNKPENRDTIVQFGAKGAENRIFKRDGADFLKSFGPSAEEIVAEENKTIREQKQMLKELGKN